MKVVLAEKPSVAMEIAKALKATKRNDGYMEGNGYQITWAYGHLISLQTPEEILGRKLEIEDLPYLPKVIPLKVIDDSGAKKQFKIVSKLFNSADEIICATDAGREGELIFRLIYEFSKAKAPIKRLWISAYNEEIIKKAFTSLINGNETEALYEGGKFRQIADWYLGYNSSIILSRKNGFPLKIGRVKTPTLFLVVKRYLENVKFVPTKFFIPKIKIETQDHNIQFITAQYDGKFEKHEEFQKIIANLYSQKKAELIKISTEEKRLATPKLYNLAELQKKANTVYGFTADETLNYLQSIYESGYVSYPRTDSQYLNKAMESDIEDILEIIDSIYAFGIDFKKYIVVSKNKSFNDSKVTDHHAIIPLKKTPVLSQLKEKEKKIYLLILISFLKAFSIPKISDFTLCEFSVKNINEKFLTKGNIVKEPGFSIFDDILKKQDSITLDDDEDKEDLVKIPPLEKGKIYFINDIIEYEGMTQAPPLLTDASLITQMETCGKNIEDEDLKEALKGKGIGTSATRASIIKELITSEYIERQKKSLVPTKLGFEIIKTLNGQKLLSPELTGEWEGQISLLEAKKISFEELKEKIKNYTKEVTEEIKLNTPKINFNPNKTSQVCPSCKTTELLQDKFKYQCENPQCNFILYKNFRGCIITEKRLSELFTKGISKGAKCKTQEGKSYTVDLIFDKSSMKINAQFDNSKSSKTKFNNKNKK